MILVIRISGHVNMPQDSEETLFRMRLRRKFTSSLFKETKENLATLQKVRNFVAYGKINPDTLKLLISRRGQSIDKKKKIDADSIILGLEKKDLQELGIKPYFRLHPPIKGINSKIHFPKGVLGDNGEKINDLVRRML